MRLAFMGTPEFSVPFLQKLQQAGHEIVAVYSQPPRKGGRRGLKEIPSPVSQAAEALGLPVFTPKSLRNEEEQQKFAALNLDAAIVVAYGLILPEPILNAPKLGCYNGHASLLPRWRGAAPIHRAIEAGDSETGIVIMRMDKGLDTGPVLCAKGAEKNRDDSEDGASKQPFISKMMLTDDTTTGEAFNFLANEGANLMVKAVACLEHGQYCLSPQAEEGVSYAQKIAKSETRIDWQQPARKIQRHISSLSPFPGAWTEMLIGEKYERVKILASHLPTQAEWQEALQAGVMVLDGQKAQSVKLLSDRQDLVPKKDVAYLAVAVCGADTNNGQNIVLLNKLQKAGGKALNAQNFLHGNNIAQLR